MAAVGLRVDGWCLADIAEKGKRAAHGRDWILQVDLQEPDERKFIRDNVDSIRRATGVAPVGYNGAAMRGTVNTLNPAG